MTDPGSPYQPDPTGQEQGATLGIRFAARLIDHILLAIVVSFILIPIVLGAVFSDVGVDEALGGTFSVGSILAGIVSAAIVIGYFALMESSRGQTLGKMILNLRTIGPDGGNPTLEQTVRRNLWYALGILPIFGGLLQIGAAVAIMVTISNSATNQGWHDEFAQTTKVIRTAA